MRTLFLLAMLIGQAPSIAAEPDNVGDVTKLTSPAASILRDLSGVVRVEAQTPAGQLDRRIIHLLDWHFVDKKSFAADLNDLADKKLSDAEINRLYAGHLQDVAAVQEEQRTVLKILIEHHGLVAVYQESLAPRDMPAFKAKIRAMRTIGKRFDQLEREVAGLEDEQIQQQVRTFRQHRRLELLQIGVTGQLYMDGLLKRVLPVEDAAAFDGANPITADGKVDLDARRIEAREDALVKNIIKGGPVAVVILGGGHDLADNVPDGCEYLRVITKEYQRVADGE